VGLERRAKKWLKNWLQNEVNCTKEVKSEDLKLFPSKQQGSFVTVVRLGNWLTSIKALGLSGRKVHDESNGKLAERKPSYKLFHHFRPSSEAKQMIRN
jgi:dsDNA-binding SOS-regulon protein